MHWYLIIAVGCFVWSIVAYVFNRKLVEARYKGYLNSCEDIAATTMQSLPYGIAWNEAEVKKFLCAFFYTHKQSLFNDAILLLRVDEARRDICKSFRSAQTRGPGDRRMRCYVNLQCLDVLADWIRQHSTLTKKQDLAAARRVMEWQLRRFPHAYDAEATAFAAR